MRRLLAGVVALLLATTLAYAQSGSSVRQSGNITPNTVPYWVTSGVIAGNVSAADSPITSFGVTSANAAASCVNSARVSSGSWQSMCLGYVSGQPTITVQANGGASQQALQFIVNGTTYPFPGALAGLTIGSTPVTGGINNNCLTVGGSVLSQTNCTLLTLGTTGTGSIVLNGSPTLSGTIGGNLTWSGTQLWSAGVIAGGSLVSTGTATPASASGNTVVMGTISAPPLANTGQAYLFNTVVGGAVLQGDGSTSDITLANKSGSTVLSVPTGTTGVTLPGVPIFSGLSSGTCASGLALDSGNHVVTGSCPGAAASIQVGSTTISSGTTANILYNNGGTLGNETIASILTAGSGISVTGTTNATITNSGVVTVKKQVFVASGTYTPSAGMVFAQIECVGGGAGGGGAAGLTAGSNGAGGGGGGSYSRLTATAATVGASQVVTIGGGGNGGVAGNNAGSAGVDTSVGTLCIGKGGTGGQGANNTGNVAQGGNGGVAGTGDFSVPGAGGGAGLNVSGTTVLGPGGYGGSSGFGFGAGGKAQAPGAGGVQVGTAGSLYGGGGSGGSYNNISANVAGGNGAAGIVVITEYNSQ